MSNLFELSAPWWELVLRGTVVYFALLVLVRLSGKRTVGEFTPFDLIVVVLLSEAVSGSLSGEDSSLPGGLIVAVVLVFLNWTIGFMTARIPALNRAVEGSPVLVARDGEVFADVLRRQSISSQEFDSEMRSSGCGSRDEIALAVLEPSGHVSFVKRDGK